MPAASVTTIAVIGIQEGSAMWPSENTASRLYNWANIGLIFSLSFGVISTVLVVWMGNIKEAFSNEKLAATTDRLGKAEQDLGKAIREAGEANRTASDAKTAQQGVEIELARAKERTAALEVEALKLRKDLAFQAPRANLIVGEKRRRLVESLKPFVNQKSDVRHSASVTMVNGRVMQTTPMGDDVLDLAKVLMGVLKEASWSLPSYPKPLPARFIGQGIRVEIVHEASPHTKAAAEALVVALKAVPLTVDGPLEIPDNAAQRMAQDGVQPVFDENTIILDVLQHPYGGGVEAKNTTGSNNCCDTLIRCEGLRSWLRSASSSQPYSPVSQIKLPTPKTAAPITSQSLLVPRSYLMTMKAPPKQPIRPTTTLHIGTHPSNGPIGGL
jgi:hypothetical protein